MVIINTRAVEVSIQAVSPALILSVVTRVGAVGAGGAAAGVAAAGAGVSAAAVAAGAAVVTAGAAAVGVSSAQTACAVSVIAPSKIKRNSLVINADPPKVFFSNRAGIALTRADAHDLREVGYKNVSITDLAGTSGLHDGFDDLIGQRIVDGNFYLG